MELECTREDKNAWYIVLIVSTYICMDALTIHFICHKREGAPANLPNFAKIYGLPEVLKGLKCE